MAQGNDRITPATAAGAAPPEPLVGDGPVAVTGFTSVDLDDDGESAGSGTDTGIGSGRLGDGGRGEPDRPLTRRGRNTYDRLVAAATEVFNAKPYADARITEITTLAGVATGSFYTYFESKDALFRIVARAALEDMLHSPRPDPDNIAGDPVRDIAYASRQYFHACHRHRLIAQSIEQLTVADPDVRGSRRDALLQGAKRAERWIVRLQQAGVCDPGVDPWYTGLALQAMNVSLAYDQLVHKDAGQAEALIDALVGAVTPVWARAVGLEDWLRTGSDAG